MQTDTKKTPIHDEHLRANGKLMAISGWARALHYGSPDEEVRAVRTAAGLFDLHPMSRHVISGGDALAFMQFLVTGDVERAVARSTAQYTCLCNQQGGIIDDVLVFPRAVDEFVITSNVSTAEAVGSWIRHWILEKGWDVQYGVVAALGTQLALQGPRSLELMAREVGPRASELEYMRFVQASILDVPVFLARTGYTGETGFELFFEPCHATRLWCRLLDEGAELGITPFGVLAAQVLRTEKGFALHGTDMSRDNNPYEMGLGWTVCLEKKEFLGKDALARIRAVGPTQRFRRFYIEGGRTVPRGTAVLSSDRRIGTVSSCCRSPTLARTVGMGLLDSSISSASECFVEGGGGRSALTFTDESFYDPEGLRVRARLNGN